MSIEDRISQSLERGLAQLDPGPADLPEVERRGRRIRRRHRLMVGAGLAAAVVAAGVVVPRLGGEGAVEPAPPTGSWQELPAAPIAGRWSALSGWTGEEVLFVGGGTSTPCPPNADCTDPDVIARDGAAYDLDAGTWREIAQAPVPMGYWFRTTMVGDTMVVLADGGGGSRWFAYDASEDDWRELPAPERSVRDWGAIPSLDGRVYALSQSGHVLVLDLASEEWSELPLSPLAPRLETQSVVPTDQGIFVSGADSTVEEDGETPKFTMVERWDGEEWTRYPATGQVGRFEHWTGTRLVSADIQTATGLRGDPPHGGVLDPATGEWRALPNAPDVEAPRPDGWSVNAAAGPLVAGWGYVYDDRTERWSLIGKPAGPVDTAQAAVWADGRLVVLGGLDDETGYADVSGLSNDAWVWRP